MAIDPSFWNGRRVFLTGHNGFKGTWLAAWLVEMGADVTGYSLAPRLNPSLYAMAGLDRRTRGLTGDIRERHTLAAAMRLSDPEIIFHLAAQPFVRSSLKDPRGTFETNVMGTVNVLDVARAMPSLKAVVAVTSDKCYERTNKPCRERDPLGGSEPYGASKAACEHVVSAYRNCFYSGARDIGLASARAGNVIGGGDFGPHRLLPDIIRAVASSKPVVIRHPTSVRPWQHVLDALSGYLDLAEALAKNPAALSDAYNFGPPNGAEWTVREVAEAAISRLGRGELLIEPVDGSIEASVLRLHSQRARERLGWKPQLAISRAVRLAIDGYEQLLKGAGTIWMFQQIEEYRALQGVKRPRPPQPMAARARDHVVALS